MKTLKVVVPLDGSSLAEAVFPLVSAIGGSHVTLVRAVPREAGGGAGTPRLAAEVALAEAADRLRASGLQHVTPIVREGAAPEVILDVASETGASLIVMTTHGGSGFRSLVLGSTAERVIRAAPLPVLALRATEPATAGAPPARPFDRVLVPYDGSEHAWRALEAIALLGAAGRGRVMLYGVVEAERGGELPPGSVPPPDLIGAYRRLQIQESGERLRRAAARALDLGIEASFDHGVGRPAAKILDHAEATAATLIAMGSHGRSGISRWALGSVAEQVLRASSAPVLICK